MGRRKVCAGVALAALAVGCTETVRRCPIEGTSPDSNGVCHYPDGAVPVPCARRLDPVGDYEDTNCDGVDGVAGNVVYVSPSGDDTGSLGDDPARPVRSLARALVVAEGTGAPRRTAILLVEGDYPVTVGVTLRDGVSVYGGYAPGWVRRGQGPSRLVGEGTVLRGENLGEGTELAHLVVESSAAERANRSSIAMRLRNPLAFTLRDVTLRASNGLPGDPGPAGETGSSGGPGADGTEGGGAGAGGGSFCHGGGLGGMGGLNAAGSEPMAGARGSGPGGGLGGRAGGAGAIDGESGGPGRDETMPARNAQGATRGTFSFDLGYAPSEPQRGQDGLPGSGGGGGGGGYTSSTAMYGGGGGGGGGGGCGGRGGQGGGSGGASVALMVEGGRVRLVGCTFATGAGGDGGVGGAGGQGGAGARGGNGGPGGSALGAGGAGGAGGVGGRGDGGGGGAAGPSVGIVRLLDARLDGATESTFVLGAAGTPGMGADASERARGEVGFSLRVYPTE